MFVYGYNSLHAAHVRVKPVKSVSNNEWNKLNSDLLYSNDNYDSSNVVHQLIAYIIIGVFVFNLILRTAMETHTVQLHSNSNITIQTVITTSIYQYIDQFMTIMPVTLLHIIQYFTNTVQSVSHSIIAPSQVLLHSIVVLLVAVALLYIVYNVINILVSRIRTVLFGLPVYLVDFTTFNAPEHWKVPYERFRTIAQNFGFQGEDLEFCMRVLEKNGLGNDTYFPPGIHLDKPNITLPLARAEAETVMFTCIDELLSRTGVRPIDIDVIITNCSLFCPTPSLSAMIMANYGMRADCENYSLGGMGCSAGLISIKLASDLLQVRRRRTLLVMSMENITQNIYVGTEKSMLVQNTLFRVGGAAMLLSNYDIKLKPTPYSSIDQYSVAQHDILQQETDRNIDVNESIDLKYWFDRSKCVAVGTPQPIRYQLQHLVRCNLASDKDAYNCVYQTMDAHENKGVRLDKCLMNVAGAALRRNMQILAPQVLPYTELAKYGIVFAYKMVQKSLRASIVGKYLPVVKEYQPNWKSAMQHYAIHAGGRAVIDAIQTGLNLTDYDTQPSRSTLARYGNTSSSSIWYELLYLEQHGRVQAGEKLWQVAFGSGFKCNSAVWRKLN